MNQSVCVCVSVRERWRVAMRHWHTACSSRPKEWMEHAALITIFIHQPVSEADSLFISNFTAVSCSLVAWKQTKPDYHVSTNHSNYFGAWPESLHIWKGWSNWTVFFFLNVGQSAHSYHCILKCHSHLVYTGNYYDTQVFLCCIINCQHLHRFLIQRQTAGLAS